MAIWKKNKDDINALKEAVSNVPEPLTGPIPSPHHRDLPPPPRPIITGPSVTMDKKGSNNPVFIKMERYEEVLRRMDQMKDVVQALADTLSVLAEVDRIRNQTMKTLKDILYDMTSVLTALDGEFLRPDDMRQHIPDSESHNINELKREISELKREVSHI